MKDKNKKIEKFFENLAKLRNHQIVENNYLNCTSKIKIVCLTHNKIYITTYKNYKRSKFGCLCCSSLKGKSRPDYVKQKISKALKDKPKKYSSWLKGKKGNSHPCYKHGLGNIRAKNKNELKKLNIWKKVVLNNYNYKCFITGLKNTSKTPLVIHHLESWDNNKDLRYEINNGVVLLKKIHKDFHDQYGFGNNTKLQFEAFCSQNYNIKKFPWRYGNHEPSFTITIQYNELLTFKQKKDKEFKKLFDSRNHKKIKGFYETGDSEIQLFCNNYKKIFFTTYKKYKKSKFGCNCCARKKQSDAVKKANRLRPLLNKLNKNKIVL